MQCHFHFYVAFIVYTVQSQLDQFTSRMGVRRLVLHLSRCSLRTLFTIEMKKKNWTTQRMSKSMSFFFGVKNIWLLYQGYSVLICTPADLWRFQFSSLPSLCFTWYARVWALLLLVAVFFWIFNSMVNVWFYRHDKFLHQTNTNKCRKMCSIKFRATNKWNVADHLITRHYVVIFSKEKKNNNKWLRYIFLSQIGLSSALDRVLVLIRQFEAFILDIWFRWIFCFVSPFFFCYSVCRERKKR